MLTKIKPYLIYFVLLLALFIRSYRIGDYPSINPDEAALGYNAYSLLQTGLDEHGASWPLHFKSFGDYKPGGYVYLALPFIKILGLTPLAVRLPNLILSVLSIYFLYKLLLLLSMSSRLSLISSLVLAISPWHIHFSRGAWESSTALSFIIIGTYFFFQSKVKNVARNFSLFVLFYVLSLYVYHSARIFAPTLALCLLVTYKSYFLNLKSKLILPIIFGILLCLPVLFSFIKNGGATRFGGVGLTADSGPLSRSNELLNQHQPLTIFTRLIHNKRSLYFLSWTQKYLSHFDLNFLFLSGDEVPRSKVPDMGQLYLLELPFLIVGLYCLLRQPSYLQLKSLLIPWLFLSPIASSLTFQAPSVLRSLPLVIPLTIITGIGITKLLTSFFNTAIVTILALLYLYSFAYYLDAYFIHYQKRYPFSWNYGFNQIVPYINSQKNNYKNIYVTNKYDQPYILYLFYSQYPPQKIQSQISLTPPDKFGFSTVTQIDNIHFQKITWAEIPDNSLIIDSDEDTIHIPTKIINFPNGSPAFKIYIK